MNETTDAWTDKFGAVASSFCALHCAVCALLPAIFATLGVGFLLTHEAEWGLNLIAIFFGVFALRFAAKTHRSRQVMVFLFGGIIGLLIGRGLEMAADHGHHGHESHAETADVAEADHHAHTAESDEHAPDDHDAHDDHGDHDAHDEAHGEGDVVHSVGAGVGVLSGMMLFFGHVLNIRTARRTREDCCD